MIKCPKCGSTAQPRAIDHQSFVWKFSVSVYLTYECGCGCKFATRLEADRENEKFYGLVEKE